MSGGVRNEAVLKKFVSPLFEEGLLDQKTNSPNPPRKKLQVMTTDWSVPVGTESPLNTGKFLTADFIKDFHFRHNKGVYEDLAVEVFKQLSEKEQEFLVVNSILRLITAEVGNQLSKGSASKMCAPGQLQESREAILPSPVPKKLTNDWENTVSTLADLVRKRLTATKTALSSPFSANDLIMKVKTFGSFQITLNAKVLASWRTQKTRDLLAYLFHMKEPTSKDRIIEDLWPDLDPRDSDGIFHTTCYYLRQLFRENNCTNMILYQNQRYQLRSNGYTSDCQRFEELTKTAARKNLSVEKIINCLEQALTLYHGDYLEDLDYPWIVADRVRLSQLYMNTRLRLAECYIKAKEFSTALHHLKILEQNDPLQEEVHCLLMQVQALLGNRKALKEQYLSFQATLAREIGLEPQQKTKELYSKLIHGFSEACIQT